ncbi:killer cell lectin-like receptor subfamily F member 1 [Lepidochelys kempii]|uniref:killer cell lectin-like receptor subfamily F member 1 n=1 Tax=Caretta caretta TaxID=8467 RepID=UPI0020956866|nr:killer cell lectin-like receptor subfamily F member 1 [Caretta caretta]
MENEDGYVVMTLQMKRINSTQPSPHGSQGSPPGLDGYKVAVGVLGAVCVLLVSAVIAQSVWGFQAGWAECDIQQAAFVSRLKQSLCDPAWSGPAGGTGCELCPKDWRAHRGKCYWDSRRSQIWSESRKDCESRNSQMLVIRDQEEMDFINTIAEGTNHIWIGLNITSHTRNWTWVDGSPLNQTLFPVSGPVASGSCGVVKGNSINSETCSAEFKWICQKDAIVV